MTTTAVKITDAEIKRQAAGEVRDLRDIEARGLYLRFAKDRTRASWYLVVRGEWKLIGRYPDLSAKQVAAALPGIRLRLDAGEGSNLSKWLLVSELLDWYADRMARDRSLSSKRKKTGASLIKCHLKPLLGAVPLASVDKSTLDDRFMWPAQESIGIDYVRSAFQLLALAFRQAFKLRLITSNPMKDVKFSDFSKAKVGVKPSRLRVTQLQDLLTLLRDSMASAPADAMLALMMLCHGTRIGETRQAQWSHVSLAEREWFIPTENTKTRCEHHLPLTHQVCALLERYRDWQAAKGYKGTYVFPARGRGPISDSQACAVSTRLGKGEWTSHDLRKVARTGWTDLGVDFLIGEMLVNHTMTRNVQTYIHTSAELLKREALNKWHDWLDGKGFGLIHRSTMTRNGNSHNDVEALNDVASSQIQKP
ncbi:tyrosine-type recombinase/integrase [Pseudomonas gorinensis]